MEKDGRWERVGTMEGNGDGRWEMVGAMEGNDDVDGSVGKLVSEGTWESAVVGELLGRTVTWAFFDHMPSQATWRKFDSSLSEESTP